MKTMKFTNIVLRAFIVLQILCDIEFCAAIFYSGLYYKSYTVSLLILLAILFIFQCYLISSVIKNTIEYDEQCQIGTGDDPKIILKNNIRKIICSIIIAAIIVLMLIKSNWIETSTIDSFYQLYDLQHKYTGFVVYTHVVTLLLILIPSISTIQKIKKA